MKIKLIGTGSITSWRNCASCLIDEKILVDCGSGIIKGLLKEKIDVTKIETVLITHLHADHFFDLPYLVLLRSFREVNNQLKVIGPSGLKKSLDMICQAGYPDIENWDNYYLKGNTVVCQRDESEFAVQDYNVDMFAVDHGKMTNSYGYRIEINKKSVCISGDSKRCEAIEKMMDCSNLAIFDCSFLQGNDAHMGIDDFLYLQSKYHTPLVATHLADETRQALMKIENDDLMVLEDGSEIKL